MGIKIAVVGATGIVGETFLKVLEEQKLKIQELRAFASQNSVGQFVEFLEQKIPVEVLTPERLQNLDLVFFSSDESISSQWAPIAVRQGAFVIDNSSAFRLQEQVPLVVPEVNGQLLDNLKQPCIIANPNCSTIQLVVALNPLLKQFGLKRVQVASYQSVSGAGKAGIEELTQQIQSTTPPVAKTFPHPIAFNCIPQISSFDALGFTGEENKIRYETKKILNSPQLPVTAFTVRVPTLIGHSEAVWVDLAQTPTRQQLLAALSQQPGLDIETAHDKYPMCLDMMGKDHVAVGRIHQDPDLAHSWLMWIVADNLRKGAASNAIQIAKILIAKNIL